MIHISIDRTSHITLNQQLYLALKLHILNGILPAKTRLPSSRHFSDFLGVSRNVVLEAYEQLTAEGFIEGRQGSGTYVADGTQLDGYMREEEQKKETLSGLRHEPNKDIIDFRTGVPDLSLFPLKTWGRIYHHICDTIHPADLDYYQPKGCYTLRYALSKHLLRTRGVISNPEQILITTGATQALSLCAKQVSKYDKIFVEFPTNADILKILQQSNASTTLIPVDEEGFRTDCLPKHTSAKLIFTTPSHHFPTGGILSAKRRIELIRFAKQNDGYIIEDDYDSEFRFAGSPIHSMQSLCPDRVIYIGTFSKKLFPALRIGFMVIPPNLMDNFFESKRLVDQHSPILEQLTLAQFINDGLLDRHISKSRRVYKEKKEHLESALKQAFGTRISCRGNNTGLHLIVDFSDTIFDHAIFQIFEKSKLRIYPIEQNSAVPHHLQNTLMLGYGNLTKAQITEGVKRLETIVK